MKLNIKVVPKSSREKITRENDILKIYIKEAPEKGKANRAVVRTLAKHFGTSQSNVKILVGHNTKNKIVQIIK